MFFRMVYKSGQIFLPFCHNSRVWRTDRLTDRRTEISSQYRVCIACSAVKIDNKRTFQRTLFSSNSARTLTHFIFAMNVRNN